MEMPSGHSSATHPMSAWRVFGWSLLVALLFVTAQFVSIFVLAWAVPDVDIIVAAGASGAFPSGIALTVATFTAAPVCLLLIFRIVRAHGTPVAPYLAWQNVVPANGYLKWFAFGTLLIALADAASSFAGRPLVPDFMRVTYATAEWTPLYWLAIVAVAPLIEEIFFRGFMFRGVERTRLGHGGAIVITSVAWSLVHTQYDLFEISIVLASGLYLGWVRWRTESTRLTYALHAYWNAVAMAQTAWFAGPV